MIDFNITFKLNVYFSIKLDFCPVILKSLALLLNPLLFFSVDSPQHPPPPRRHIVVNSIISKHPHFWCKYMGVVVYRSL